MKKCAFGHGLPILGPMVEPTEKGYICRLTRERADKYLAVINVALETKELVWNRKEIGRTTFLVIPISI